MPSESIVWTALPHGVDGQGANRRIRLSILVSPRLTVDKGNDRIGAFAEFAHWTQRVASSETTFEVRWRTEAGQSGSAGLVASLPQTLQPALWDRLVWEPVDRPVRTRSVRNLIDSPVATFAAAPGFAAIRKTYQDAAVSAILGYSQSESANETLTRLRALQAAVAAGNEPWIAPDGSRYQVRTPDEALQIATERAGERRRQRAAGSDELAGAGPVRISAFERVDAMFSSDGREDESDPAVAIGQVLAFHQQALLASEEMARVQNEPAGPPEFHELMTAVGNFPELSRRLGLVFELEIAVAQLGIADRGFIQVIPRWTPALAAGPITPWTAVDVRSGYPYSSARNPSKVDRGFLVSSLSGPGRLDVVPIDLASATLKLGVMSGQGADDPLLPSLRSAGFAVVRSGQAALVHQVQNRAVRNDARARSDDDAEVDDLLLYAEDINRGYRLDVKTAGAGSWRSLYRLDRTVQTEDTSWEVEEEGLTQLSAVEAVASSPEPAPYLLMDETIATWNGWSASAPRPGLGLRPDGSAGAPSEWLDLGGIPLRQRVTPGSLPRLRYGSRYRFRVRTVDLAGNARALADEPENEAALLPGPDDTLTCHRFEPLEAPVLVPLAKLGEGETIDRLVVRSSADLSVRTFRRRHRATAAANQRHLAPAKTTQVVAEMHGRFDGAFGTGPGSAEAAARAYELARREGGTLGGSESIPLGEPDDAVTYTIHPEPALRIPYLPDPLGRGVALRNLPGPRNGKWANVGADGNLAFQDSGAIRTGNVVRISYGEDASWPDMLPFRIQLEGSSGFRLPRWSAAERLLTVSLPPGEEIGVGLRTYVEANDLDRLGVWQWAEDELIARDAADPAAAEDLSLRRLRAAAGDFWFLTPERRLHLVHAVQQPIAPPVIVRLACLRAPGSTYAELDNRITLHARTTGRLDLTARWTDTLDPVTEPPYDVTKRAHVRSQQINVFPGYDDWANGDREALWLQKDSQMLTHYGALENPGYPTAKPVSEDGAQIANPSNLMASVRHELGDTKYRSVTYQLTAGTRFREYFPESVTSDPDNITLPSIEETIDILSSARPAAPSVPYAVPAFRWRTPATPALAQERQRWGGVRVYLERPWYSSGAGEFLAVVLWAGGVWPPPAELAPYVTRWGTDPIWSSAGGGLAQTPAPTHFPLRKPGFDGQLFSLPGLAAAYGTAFAVAAHDIAFPQDDEPTLAGRCWCDIQIEPGLAYSPFVRLAVARFQPKSIPDAHLSAVALTDFVQLAAHRSVTLTPQAGGTLAVTVAGEVTGRGFDLGGGLLAANQIEVGLERRIPGLPDELGWEEAPAAVSPASSPDSGALWSGTVTVPAGGPAVQHRLVIREYEFLPSDDAPAGSPGRLVFADTIPLP